MPQIEAAACGVPVMSVDYSAMSDVVRKLNGFPIKVKAMVREAATGRYMAAPDNEDFVQQLTDLLSLPESVRRNHGYRARMAVQQHYSYDRTAKLWENHFDGVPSSAGWTSPPRFHQPQLRVPDGLSNDDFVRWGITHVAGRPELAGSFTTVRMTRDLNLEAAAPTTGGDYFNELSAAHGLQSRWQPFNREIAGRVFLQMAEKRNHWEERRAALLGGKS